MQLSVGVICWMLIVWLLGFIASRWSLFWSYLQYGGKTHCFFWGDMLQNCRYYTLVAIKEEIIYRCLPFVGITSILMLLKPGIIKNVVILCGIILIIIIQLQFGYLHFHPENSGTTSWYHIKLQGGLGIFLAITYGLLFYFAMKILYKRIKYPILSFVTCHFLAILTSIWVHAINNILITIAQSY